MRFSIRLKLLLVLLLSTALVVAAMLAFTNWSFQTGFVGFVEQAQQARIQTLTQQLAEIYDEEHGWQRLATSPRRWARLVFSRGDIDMHGHDDDDDHHARDGRWRRSSPPHRWPPRMHDRHDGPAPLALRVMLLDADKSLIYGQTERVGLAKLHAIDVRGTTVGYLGVLPGPPLTETGEVRFLERQRHAFVVIGLAMLGLSGVVALLLAGRLVKPLNAFTQGAQALAAGRFETRIPVQSRDELGQLARDFNWLAKTLASNEQQRRQWVADISHELRTPLSVMRGELEALQDGVRPLTPDAVSSLHAETLRLGRLIDDLYELARSDLGALDYHMTRVDPVEILRDTARSLSGLYAERSLGLTINDELPAPRRVTADPERLAQLFRNLLTNSLYYTDVGGQVQVNFEQSDNLLLIDIMDSAPGVSAAHLPKLFDRLYRVEPSRSRAHGGAGLGLALCRSIAAAHDGSISAQPSPLGGLWIRLTLPATS